MESETSSFENRIYNGSLGLMVNYAGKKSRISWDEEMERVVPDHSGGQSREKGEGGSVMGVMTGAMIQAAVLVSGILIVRKNVWRELHAYVRYSLWLLVALRLLMPVQFL